MSHRIDITEAVEQFVDTLLSDPDGRDVEVERDNLLAIIHGWDQERRTDEAREGLPPEAEGQVVEDATTGEDHVIHTRVELLPATPGKSTPLFLDLGQDNAIVVQPKDDQKDGELALNVCIGGGIDLEVVAWLLHQASDAMVHGIQQRKYELEVPR